MIIGIAGKTGSGKTFLANALAKHLNCPLTGFGKFVEKIAKERGLKIARATLQGIGEELVKNPESFCASVLSFGGYAPGGNIVIDGIRHIAIVDCLRRVSNGEFFLVYLVIEEKARIERLTLRDFISAADISVSDEHSTEMQVAKIIRKEADINIDGLLEVGEKIGQILDRLSKTSQKRQAKNL